MYRFIRTAAVLGVVLASIAACGSDEEAADTTAAAASTAPAGSTAAPPTTAAETTEAPETTGADTTVVDITLDTSNVEPVYSVEAANGTVTLDAEPTHIVSISPSQTESLFAIGAGDQVVAVDSLSNYPEEAAAVLTDLSVFEPNVEAIASYDPDLVVMADDFTGLIPLLEDLGIAVWSGPAAVDLDDAYAQIEQLGVLTGHIDGAAQVVADIQAGIEAALAEKPEGETPFTYYHEVDDTYFSATSHTFIGQMYTLAGLQNIADDVEPGNDYPQLSAEYIITSNPELIFLADAGCCGQSLETVAARDGWGDIAAVQNGNVIALDDDIASRWGPRVVDLLELIIEGVKAASAVATG